MEMIKAAGDTGANMIRDLATAIIRDGKVPTDWEQSFIVCLYTLRDVSYNARWFWTTIRYGPMTTANLCWTTGNGF